MGQNMSKRSCSPTVNDGTEDETALYWAARWGNLAVVKTLLENGTDPNKAKMDNGETALYWAARINNVQMVRLLLTYGADPNKARTDNGETPLFWAAFKNNIEIVKFLLENGAHLNIATTDDGVTPLYWAAFNNNIEIVKFLLENGAHPNIATTDNEVTPLYWAAFYNNMKMVELLLENAADPNTATDNGETPIFQAVCHNNMEMVKVLVLYGANVAARIHARNVAEQKGHGDIVDFFEKIKGWTTFQIAVSLPDLQLREIKNLLQRYVLDPDECGGSLAAVHALAASNTSKPEEMKRIVRWAFEGWTPYSNCLYSQLFQENVKTTLMIAQQLEVASEKEESTVVCLPLELWLLVLNFVNRKDW
jgi:ankyrin repeat protein